MKKIKLLMAIGTALLLSGCGNNQWIDYNFTFNYVFVKSRISGEKYYHIKGWKEFAPEITTKGDFNKLYAEYVGLQIETIKGNVYYWYEQNLEYMFTKNYVERLGTALEE